LNEIDRGAEELVPLMIYIVLQSRLSHLYSEFKYMEEFIYESEMLRERGYYLVTLQTVFSAIKQLDFDHVSILYHFYQLHYSN